MVHCQMSQRMTLVAKLLVSVVVTSLGLTLSVLLAVLVTITSSWPTIDVVISVLVLVTSLDLTLIFVEPVSGR
jgi:hypothetical protein